MVLNLPSSKILLLFVCVLFANLISTCMQIHSISHPLSNFRLLLCTFTSASVVTSMRAKILDRFFSFPDFLTTSTLIQDGKDKKRIKNNHFCDKSTPI